MSVGVLECWSIGVLDKVDNIHLKLIPNEQYIMKKAKTL